MLVLSRQRDETIMIGDDIEITVVDIRGDKVRLGITAPTKIAVHRKEVYEAIKRENEQASHISGSDLAVIRPGVASGPSRAQTRTRTNQLTSGHAPPGTGGPSGPPFAKPGEPPPRTGIRAQGA
ncbi:MAG: carbon storage regulator CsrA [Phycisphaerales bacterium]